MSHQTMEPAMMSLLTLHMIAAARGDGLRPELLAAKTSVQPVTMVAGHAMRALNAGWPQRSQHVRFRRIEA
ncbi:hypothetical protein BC374_17885 [Ensifer sp. LC13]|nr:hypothetical protein BC362_10080 [Ensifer sp. LC14]OCP10942.1 hypothetical protein BC374_17885 [Ensifer sp. LC13]OCP11515.1 hypothetical protein BBX50_17975 [Ensifer sp. LC11]OCP33331.1 hypothetical protein BC364_16860 [Ensifer sp. LC499]